MRALFVSLVVAAAALGQPAPKFPAASATWQDLLVAKPMARATLTAGITDVATAIPVSDGAQYAAFSAVQVQDEVILVCSVDGNTLNVCPGGRGFSGTAAAAHGIGLAVRNTITTHHHNQVAAEVKAIEEALGPNLSNVASSWDNISGKPTTFLFSDQSYTDPAWLTISKGKVGLGNVENTALSTWAGSASITILGTIASGTVPWARLTGQPATWAPSAHTHGTAELTDLSTWAGSTSITTLGTISAGTVPWARLSSVPSTFAPSAHTHPVGDLSTVGDYSSKITSGTYSINISGSAGSAGSVTNGVVTTGSYTDPAWLTLTKGKVGLGSVENTALSTWAGSGNITTLGTIASGTVPWARLSSVPGSFTPSAHSHAIGDLSTVGDYSSKITSGTYSINVTGSAGSAASVTGTNANYTVTAGEDNGLCFWQACGTYKVSMGSGANFNYGPVTDYSMRFLMASGAGRGFVWRGDGGNIAGLNGTTGNMQIAGQMTATQFNGPLNGNASSASAVAWSGVSSKPAAMANMTSKGVRAYELGCGNSYNEFSCDNGGNGYIDYADSAGYASSAGSAPANGGNSTTVAGLAVHGGRNNEANKIARTDGNGYLPTGYINSEHGIDGGDPVYFVYNSGDNYLRYTAKATAANAVMNAVAHQGSFAWVDPYIALPTGLVMYGVFTPQANQATITKVWCWSDDNSSVIQLRRSDGGDMLPGNMACGTGGVTRTDFNGYQVIPVNYTVGIWQVSGAAKQIRVGFTYTTTY